MYSLTLTSDTPAPTGKQAIAGMLASARIPGAIGMPAYKQGPSKRRNTINASNRRDASKTMDAGSNRKAIPRLPASTGKASGSGKPSQLQLRQTTVVT